MKLRYTLPAPADLKEVLDTIAVRPPQGARRVQARVQAVIDPYVGTLTNDPTIRRMTASPYLYPVFYRVTETDLITHASGMAPGLPQTGSKSSSFHSSADAPASAWIRASSARSSAAGPA